MIDVIETTTSPGAPAWKVHAALMGGLTVVVDPGSVSAQSQQMPAVQTAPVHRERYASHQFSGLDEGVASYLTGWQVQQAPREWYFELSERLVELSKKDDGWKGDDSVAASEATLKYARDLLWKLAQEGIDRAPKVGLDYEGTFSFMWFDEDVKADLTVYGDGTYSFFAKDHSLDAAVDEARISEPLDGRLLSVLLG